jgi:hypothetical protein
MSDTVWLALIGLVGLIIKDFLDGRRAARLRTQTVEAEERAASRVKAVKDTLEATNKKTDLNAIGVANALNTATEKTKEQLDEIRLTGDKVHILVNNAMMLSLTSNVALARRILDLQPTPENRSALEAAEKALSDHKDKQTVVDHMP